VAEKHQGTSSSSVRS